MKELMVNAVDQRKAAFFRNAAALHEQVAAVVRDGTTPGYHRAGMVKGRLSQAPDKPKL